MATDTATSPFATPLIKDASTALAIRYPRAESCGEPRRPTPPRPTILSTSTVVRSVDDARTAVRDQIAHGADWIKLFPTGAYSFTASGVAEYVVTYPLPVFKP